MIRRVDIHRDSRRTLACIVVLASYCSATAAREPPICSGSAGRPAGPPWDASSANASVGGLRVHRLRACVERKGDHFSAALIDAHGAVNQTITGTVRANRVTAQRAVMGSDNIGEGVTGSWTVSPIAPYRMHTIVLTNPWLSIVMTRSDYRGKPLPFTPRE